MAQQFERARRVAATGRMVLLTGPTGSGRRTARWIHELSGLKGSFVEILAREFIESLGAFREAQGGTLLITDIEELEGEALSALPRALANQELLALEARGRVAGETRHFGRAESREGSFVSVAISDWRRGLAVATSESPSRRSGLVGLSIPGAL